MVLLDSFKTGADKPVLEDRDEVDRLYRSKRRSVFFALVFGYSFFYVCRLTLSIAKKPMIDEGLLNSAQMGQIGFAFFLAYAFGKLTNGFLADRSNIGRFMSTGLMVSAIILVLFGFTRAFLLFAILWGVNGWFQSMGSAPSGASSFASFPRACCNGWASPRRSSTILRSSSSMSRCPDSTLWDVARLGT